MLWLKLAKRWFKRKRRYSNAEQMHWMCLFKAAEAGEI